MVDLKSINHSYDLKAWWQTSPSHGKGSQGKIMLPKLRLMDLRGKYYRSTRLARFGTARSGVDSQKREILHG